MLVLTLTSTYILLYSSMSRALIETDVYRKSSFSGIFRPPVVSKEIKVIFAKGLGKAII